MDSSEDKEKKAYEERLQRRLKILKEQLEHGKVHIPHDARLIKSLTSVRLAPDGNIDLSTVDGAVRSLALGIEYFHDREELKKSISLSEIQNTYFNFLEKNFGSYYEIMQKREMIPHIAGIALSRKSSSITELTKNLPDFLEVIKQFWESTADAAHAHVEDMNKNMKGVFGGDLFPANDENIASKCGIYTDTLILPCPFLRSLDLFKLWSPKDQAYYLIKHSLNLLQYKTLACAEVTPPIVVILPDVVAINEEEKKFFLKLGQDDALIHAGKVFGRKFSSFEELIEFASKLDTIKKLSSKIFDPKRILFDTEWQGNVEEQLQRALNEEPGQLLRTKNPGIIVASFALGRMGVSNELLIKARRLRGTPIIEAPTSWQYFVWKLEYDAENAGRENNLTDLHVLKALQSLSDSDMQWLGHVPPDALIELRKTNALEEIRGILSKGISDLTEANPLNFHRTTDQIFDNINEAFDKHRKNIEDLKKKKWIFAGSDIGSWLVTGSLAITAAATGLPVWGLAAIASDQLLNAPKLKDIPNSIKKLAEESRKINKSPVGMMFKYATKKA